jgi:uncharacterized BrkB/YihY/UPF0761 family membrane protein
VHQSKVSEVVRRTLSELTPGSTKDVVNRALTDSKHAGSGGSLALWLGLLFAVIAVTTAMGQIERGANRIYGVERDRPTMKKYAWALFMGTAGLLMTLGFLVLIAGPAVDRRWPLSTAGATERSNCGVGAPAAWCAARARFGDCHLSALRAPPNRG